MKNIFILLSLSLGLYSTQISAQSNIAFIKKTTIGGNGWWDYISVSEKDRRVYVSHADQVEVLNADTHAKIGVITGVKGVHGISAVPDLNKGYITNGSANNVSVFDIKSLKIIKTIPAGKNPDALLYDKFSERVFIFNNDSKDITIIDALKDTVVSIIDIGGNPEAGVANDKGLIYVNVEDIDEIVAFESKTLKTVHRFKLHKDDEPTGLAFDKKTHRLFCACRKSKLMIVLDADNGKIIAQLPIGNGVDGAAFDDKSKLAYSSNGDGTLTVVKEVTPDSFKLVQNIKTETGARTCALDAKTHHVFLVTAKFGERPIPTSENPRPRAPILPNSFMLLEYGKK